MPSALRNLFLPLHRLAHRSADPDLLHARRDWTLALMLAAAGRSASPDATVVEIGCGDGWIAHRLGQRCARVVGLDINPRRVAASAAPNVLLVAADGRRPPIRPASADLIISLTVLEHLPDRSAALAQMAALLKPGGVMVHSVPTSLWKVDQFLRFIPDAVVKQLRGLTRALTGQRKNRSAKYFTGRETNNPARASRRHWWRKLYPRVHGEYASNLDEYLQWRISAWTRQVEAAGLRVQTVVPLMPVFLLGRKPSRPAAFLARQGFAATAALVIVKD